MEFHQKIYELVRRIPYGKVSSYGQLAVLAGRPGAARAVGHAMRVCREPIHSLSSGRSSGWLHYRFL